MKALTVTSQAASLDPRSYVIVAFPKEFQKSFFQSLDKRFVTILCVAFLSVNSLLIYQVTHQTKLSNGTIDIGRLLKKANLIRISSDLIDPTLEKANVDQTITLNDKVRENRESIQNRDRSDFRSMMHDRTQNRLDQIQRNAQNQMSRYAFEQNDNKYAIALATSDYRDPKFMSFDYRNALASTDPRRSAIDGQFTENSTMTIDDHRTTIDPGLIVTVNPTDMHSGIIRIANPTIESSRNTASVSAEMITAAIARNETAIQSVYQRFLKSFNTLKGKISVKILFDAMGKVKNISVTENTTGNDDFAQAVVSKIRGWQFPKLERKNATVTINQSFVFSN